MPQPKKLIEVAIPVKEISAECIRDDRIQHGHISSLHKWWARRPLPVCRAVVFASLVPDPLDENCPQAFRDAVQIVLGKENNPGDPYKPYDDIPYTSIVDPMEDNLRNRLQMFIGKYSDKFSQNEKAGKKTDAKEQLHEASLIKWDNKNNEIVINKARKLIWVSHNASNGATAVDLLAQCDAAFKAIKDAEYDLYNTPDRHIQTEEIKVKEEKLHQAIEYFLDQMPRVFDPFAGGGAIPLEAARLGCRSFGNDINPVAHIIQRGSVEFPQKYGKPISYSASEFEKLYGHEELVRWCKENGQHPDAENLWIDIPNRLSFDVEFYANKILAETEKEIGHLYPSDKKGKKPILYYWAKVGSCVNPSCKAEVPLLKGFYLANTKSKQYYLKPVINDGIINFTIEKGIYSEEKLKGWNNRGNLVCPCCHNITEVRKIKEQSLKGLIGERLLAVIYESENGKEYRLPTAHEMNIINSVPNIVPPNEKMQRNSAGGDTFSWGITEWGQLFSPRQLLALTTVAKILTNLEISTAKHEKDYYLAVKTYLGIWVDRLASRMTKFGLIDLGGEKVVDLFGRQAIPMVFDYPEMNILHLEQISWISRYIVSEGGLFNYSLVNNSSSGEKNQYESKTIDATITDPPYYDAMAYADLSDFFYVWLKRTIASLYPSNFATPQTPKSEECTMLKHHHNGDLQIAKDHFENTLLKIFCSIEHQTETLVSIMFAHQSTEAWSTLCNSILGANMNITGSWSIDTEKKGGLKENKAFLSSSVTVSCRPSCKSGVGDFKEIKNAIDKIIKIEVKVLYELGFRGADLLTACFGKAVSEFGKYEKVEKADGSEVTVAELLNMTREAAFNALVRGFETDDFTRFYIGWLQLYGLSESDFDDVNMLIKVGLAIETHDLFTENLLIKNGNKQTLATFNERISGNSKLGEKTSSSEIDKAHRAMFLFKSGNRPALLQFVAMNAATPESSFWRVLASLVEILPIGIDDYKQASELLANKDSLIRESISAQKVSTTQTTLDL